MNVNRVILIGRLTRDPEFRQVNAVGGQQTPVTTLGLATNRNWTDPAGEKQQETTFVDVTLWARTAEVAAEYLRKGDPVFIEGRLKLDTWETDGQKCSKLSVVDQQMQMLGSRDQSAQGSPNAAEQSEPAAEHAPF